MVDDTAKNANISLRGSIIEWIDKNRVGKEFKTRSDYVQYLVWRDSRVSKVDHFAEILSMMILPLIAFISYMVITVLTGGTLFFLFMSIFGLFAVMLSVVYYRQHGPKR